MTKAYCMLGLDANGNMFYEMVDAENSHCIDYFKDATEAKAYAAANNIEIIEWIND